MDKVFLAMDILVIVATTDVRRVTPSAATDVPLVIIVPMEIVHPRVLLARTRQVVLQHVHHALLAISRIRSQAQEHQHVLPASLATIRPHRRLLVSFVRQATTRQITHARRQRVQRAQVRL